VPAVRPVAPRRREAGRAGQSLNQVIPESFKQDLLNRVDIVDVIEHFVPLKKAGANHVACCPFHSEKTPSFTVSPSKQFYHCFGCGAHGNAIGFLMEYSGLGYVEAVKDLADRAGMKMPEFETPGKTHAPSGPDLYEIMQRAAAYYRESLGSATRAIDYLKGRGLTGRIAAHFGIGYAPEGWQNLQSVFANYQEKSLKDCGLVIDGEGGRRYDRFRDRIIFPIHNQRGSVIGFGGRVIGGGESAEGEGKGSAGPKYLNSPETPLFEKGRELYGLMQARNGIRAAGRVLVVEGYMDVVALAQHGIDYSVATLGTATTANHVQKLFRQSDEVIFCFDGDAAGVRAAWHALEVALPVLADHKAVRFLLLPPEHDPDSFVREHGRQVFEELLSKARPLSEFLLDGLQRRVDMGTLEGRSRLLHEAKPLLKRIPAPALQLQLVKKLAEFTGMTHRETAEMLEMRALAAGTREAAPARGNRPMAQTLERTLLKRLMVKPELAKRLPVEYLDRSNSDALGIVALADFARNAASPNSEAILIEHFRGSEFETLFNQLRSELLVLSLTPDQAEAEFPDALRSLERRYVRNQLTALQRKAEQGIINGEEKIEMGRLARRLNALDQPA